MMAELFNVDDHLNNYIARFIRKRIYVNGVIYNSDIKKFEPAKPKFTNAVYNELEAECFRFFGIKEKNPAVTKSIEKLIQRTQETTDFNPRYVVQETSIDPIEIPILQHIVLKEEFAETNLLSIGGGRFVVIAANRSTLMEGDILEAVTAPWNVNRTERFQFKLYRGNDATAYIPDELPKTIGKDQYRIDYTFAFNPIREIGFYYPSDIYGIFDSNFKDGKETGGLEKDVVLTDTDARLFIELVSTAVKDRRFITKEGYEELHRIACTYHISLYTLNTIIELKDNQENTESKPYNHDDWKSNIPKEVITKLKKEEAQEKKKEVADLQKEYSSTLKKRSKGGGRFLFFFYRPISFDKQTEKYLGEISGRLEDLAREDANYGTIGWAENQKKEFLKGNEKSRKLNLIGGLKVFGIFIVLCGVAYLYLASKEGFVNYHVAAKQADVLREEGKYIEAEEAYQLAKNNFTPPMMSFLVYFKTKNKIKETEQMIDEEVSEKIKSIEALLKADKGKFKPHTEQMLFRLIELRESNPEVLDLKKKWLNQ